MSLDFWAVKLKDNITKEDWNKENYWDLIEEQDADFECLLSKELSEFILTKNDNHWYQFCVDTVDCFVSGDPICEESKNDINVLSDKLNNFIKENSDYEYTYKEYYYVDANNKNIIKNIQMKK